MRQYRLFYKRGKAAKFTTIQPGLHDNLIDHQELRDAIEHMRLNPHIEGVSLRLLDNELFNVIAFDQEAEAPNAFRFAESDEDDTVLADESSPLKDVANMLPTGCCSPVVCCGIDVGKDGPVLSTQTFPPPEIPGPVTVRVGDQSFTTPGGTKPMMARDDPRWDDAPGFRLNRDGTITDLPERKSFAESYGVDPAQQPVDGDTANDGLTNH